MWQNWVNVVVGVLLIIVPWFVQSLDPLKWVSVIAGIIVAVAAYWANTQAHAKTGS
ncbi:MAG TPA: SPW repeat protein [Limnochordales bacterium]